MKGCEECPKSEDVWLESARLMVSANKAKEEKRKGSALRLLM